VGVDFGGFGALVAEEFLDVAEVGAGFEEVGGEGVAEGVDADGFCDACGLEGIFENSLSCAFRYVPVGFVAFEYPAFGFVFKHVFCQQPCALIGKNGHAVFGAFAVFYPDHASFKGNIGELEPANFADPEP